MFEKSPEDRFTSITADDLRETYADEFGEDGVPEGPLKPATQRDLRILAFYFVYAVDRWDYQVTLEQVVDEFRKGFELEVGDTSFAITLARGAIDERDALDVLIKPLLKNWTFDRLGCCTRLILRMAIWELQHMPVAPRVVINEAIELAKSFAERDAYKFVNGILDEYCKANNLTSE